MKNLSKISNEVKLTKNNKTHLVFPKELLETIDELIGKRKRSQFVVEAVKERLARERLARILEKAAGCWTDKNHPELKTKKDLYRYVRNLRKSADRRQKKIYG